MNLFNSLKNSGSRLITILVTNKTQILKTLAFIIIISLLIWLLYDRQVLLDNINIIGNRVSKLDHQPYNQIPVFFEGFRGKDNLSPTGYLNELQLFQSLSLDDQHDYMLMSRIDKQKKYPNLI